MFAFSNQNGRLLELDRSSQNNLLSQKKGTFTVAGALCCVQCLRRSVNCVADMVKQFWDCLGFLPMGNLTCNKWDGGAECLLDFFVS